MIDETAEFFSFGNQGIFGFLHPNNFYWSFCVYGFMGGFWGICGYILAMKYYPPTVAVNCLLLEPLISQLLGVYWGIDEVPGLLTWLGVAIVMLAINLLHHGAGLKEKEKQLQDEDYHRNK